MVALARVRRRKVVHAVRQRIEEDGRRERIGEEEPRCEAGPVLHPDPHVSLLHSAPILWRLYDRPRVDLRLTERQVALREEAAAFATSLRPGLEEDPEWRRQGMLSDGDSRVMTRALGDAGWIGMTWPAERGGRGLTHVDTALVEDVFGYHWLPLSLYLLSYKTIGCALERYASPELQDRLLGPIARGELTFCQGFSEPGAGSDLASLTTRAVRRNGTWVVDGHKIWTSSAWLADWIYLAVRTNPDEPRHRGISVLVAPIDTPGIEVRRFPVLGGGYLCEVFLDGVEIPAENLVGEVDRGWDVLMHTLDFERITAEKLGGLAWVVDSLERRLAETERLEAGWDRVARLRGELAAARLLSLRAADLIDRGDPASAASAMAKLAGARLAQRLAREGIDLLGVEGLADGHASSPLEGRIGGLYRASVGSTISGGSAEILQLVIARRGLGLR
jgi:alkylation response protein AidB-like acyl-CoA dehydrogenase